MIDKVVDLCGGSVNGKTIAVFGVTSTGHGRHARGSLPDNPARAPRRGCLEVRQLLPSVHRMSNSSAAADNAEAVRILTEWNELRPLGAARLAKAMARMADLRNHNGSDDVTKAGCEAHLGVRRGCEGGMLRTCV